MSINELPLREWGVIFYPTTGAARLCPTLDFARRTLTSDSSFKQHVYKSANDFRIKFDHAMLESCWRKAHETARWRLPKTAIGNLDEYKPVAPDCTTLELAELLWEMLQDVGDRLTAPRMETTKTKENYEFKLGDIHALISDEEKFKEKYNKQARTVLSAIYENRQQFMNEEQIKKLIYELVASRALKTKQKPWVIFQYYRPEFIKDGYIVRGRAPKMRTE